MRSDAGTVDHYLADLPAERRQAIGAVRAVILAHLPPGYDEVMEYGMISYVVPLERYPHTYNGKPLGVAALASQKRHMSLYLMGISGERDARFREAYRATGKRLDMGKSCVRFRRLEDLPLDLVGEAIAASPVDDFIASYERSRPG